MAVCVCIISLFHNEDCDTIYMYCYFTIKNLLLLLIRHCQQMDIATTLLEYGGKANAESKAGFTPLHLSTQEGHTDMTSLLIEHQANVDHQAKVSYLVIL